MGRRCVPHVRYTVWDNRTDELVILDGTARECAEAMKVKISTFYSLVTWTESGRNKKWHIEKIDCSNAGHCCRWCKHFVQGVRHKGYCKARPYIFTIGGRKVALFNGEPKLRVVAWSRRPCKLYEKEREREQKSGT